MRASVAFDYSEPRVATNFEGQFGGIADKGGDRVPFGEAGCKSGRAYSTCETMSAQRICEWAEFIEGVPAAPMIRTLIFAAAKG